MNTYDNGNRINERSVCKMRLLHVVLSVSLGLSLISTFPEEAVANEPIIDVKYTLDEVYEADDVLDASYRNPWESNDTYRYKQWHLDYLNYENVIAGLPVSTRVKVAVLDTGIDRSNEDLQGVSIEQGFTPAKANPTNDNRPDCRDGCFHGTAVAGVIAALSNNEKGITGAAEHISLIDSPVLKTAATNLAYAINDAVQKGAKVINISGTYEWYDNPKIDEAIENAEKHGVVIVAAAGNDGVGSKLTGPANYKTVIGVGNHKANGEMADSSSRGPMVDVVAPGTHISTILPGVNGGGELTGTSLAAPIVTAAVVRLIQANPSITPDQVRQKLYSSTDTIPGQSKLSQGHGRLSLNKLFGRSDNNVYSISRYAGDSRVETAIAISKATFRNKSASNVVIAQGYDFPDALVAGSLAKKMNASLLVTAKDKLHPAVKLEIQRVIGNNGNVFLMGGNAALSSAVENEVRSLGFSTHRIAGLNRVDTALKAAEFIRGKGTSGPIFISDGGDFQSSIIAGSVAARKDGTHLLVDPSNSKLIDEYLRTRSEGRSSIFIVKRHGGRLLNANSTIEYDDAPDLSSRVARQYPPGKPVIGVASAATFPDGLAGGLHVARNDGMLLLVDEKNAWLKDVSPRYYHSWFSGLRRRNDPRLMVYGGELSISSKYISSLIP